MGRAERQDATAGWHGVHPYKWQNRCVLAVLLPALLPVLLVALLAACTGNGDEMRAQLAELERMNSADSLMTNDSLAEALPAYFDRHGTPNEQMRAHYILGRTYADLGEAPAALDAYLHAADCADTTSADCDYAKLSRVYAQMASIFYHQNLVKDNLTCLDKSIQAAYKAKDTVTAINSYAQKILAYKQLKEHDSVIVICNKVYTQYSAMGQKKVAAMYYAASVKDLIAQMRIKEAKEHLDLYEAESGYFDSNHNIEKGREVYYYIKGNYFMAIHQYDSAEYYYRKELRDGKDFNNQNCGSHGLALLFQQIHKSDSAAKYSMYSYAMNDSVYSQMATQSVEQVKGMYDYTRHQREAQIERERAEKENRRFLYASALAVCILLAIVVLFYKYRRQIAHRKIETAQYQKLFHRHQQAEDELMHLRNHETEFQKLVREKEQMLEQHEAETIELERLRKSEYNLNSIIRLKEKETTELHAELGKFLQKNTNVKDYFFTIKAYTDIRKKTDNGKMLTSDDWDTLIALMEEQLPGFNIFLSMKDHLLTERERQVCILIRLFFAPKSIANALDIDKSIVTRIRISLHQKLFEASGTSRELDKKILHII